VHIPWGDVQLFLAIAETGSLSAASKRLLVTQPTVSRRLAELERAIGEPLFARSVEGTSLTSFGERMIGPARRMAEEAGELERLASGDSGAPRGIVRVSAAPGVAFELLAPFAAYARQKLPEVRLEVNATISYVDLARREADLALRFDKPPARDLVLLATVSHPVRAFATRAYAAKLPRGYGLADVGWVGWPPALAHLPPTAQLAARIPGFAPVFASDDFLVQLRAAEAGVGAVVLGRGRSTRALPTSLVELDLDFGKIRATTYLVCAKSALAIPRVRAVADLLVAELEKTES
jgi:DNA-binding transcriptional LysR family regulator